MLQILMLNEKDTFAHATKKLGASADAGVS